MKIFSTIGLASALFLCSLTYQAAASAAVIGFESFSVGDVVSGPGVFSDLTFSAGSEPIIVTGDIPGPNFSGTKSALAQIDEFGNRTRYRADFLISNVNSVSVVLGDYDADPDNLFLKAFNSSNILIDETSFALDASVNGGPTLAISAPNIAYVTFGSTGTFPNSVYFDNFTYTPVPEPSSILGTLALGAFGAGLVLKYKLRTKQKLVNGFRIQGD